MKPPTIDAARHEDRPATLAQLRASGWRSRSVKQEIYDNFVAALQRGEELFPGIVGYDDTVIPEINNAILSKHDILFLGEKGQAKSRLMRLLTRFLDPYVPYIDFSRADFTTEGTESTEENRGQRSEVSGQRPESLNQHPSVSSVFSVVNSLVSCPVHEDPYHPITRIGKEFVASRSEDQVPIAWWPREERYVERLAPGTKFADIIGEIDPAKLAGGMSMSAEEALHFGLIPRMHRGIFAMNELPDLDDLVQVGLFNILEERDVQIRGYPVRFDVDVLILFSANPTTYNRSGKVIPQLKDRIGSTIQTHYPRERAAGIAIMKQEAGVELGGEYPVLIPPFMEEIIEQISISARKSKYVDHQSGVSTRFSIANFRTMIASARQRGIRLSEKPAVPRITDLAHILSSSIGKLELDMMGSHQMSEKQALSAIVADAIKIVFEEYVDQHGLGEIADVFGKGVKVEVGDMLPSRVYAERLKRVPPAWTKAFEVNAANDPAVRASCVEFVLAGLYATDRISRSERHGRITYEMPDLT